MYLYKYLVLLNRKKLVILHIIWLHGIRAGIMALPEFIVILLEAIVASGEK